MTSRRLAALLAALAVGAAALAVDRTEAAFYSAPGNGQSSYAVAPDFMAPTVARTRVADPYNGPTFAVRQCRFYQAYAEVIDTGNPPSGVASVVADLSALTSGLGADSLLPGSYSLDGVSYGWRSLPRLATAAPGSPTYALTPADNAGNSRRQGDNPATVAARPAVAAVFLTGLEQGVASPSAPGPFDTVVGTGVSADAAVSRNGAFSLRVAAAGSAAHATVTLAGSDTVVVRFALRLTALPAATSDLFTVLASGGSPAYLVFNASSGRLGVRWGSAAIVDGTVSPQAGAWHTIEMRASLASPHTLNWRVDAADQAAASSTEAARTVTGIRFGTAAAGLAYTAHIDDVLASQAAADYPLGNGKVLALTVDGAGAHSQPNRFRNDDDTTVDGTTPSRLDETPQATTADYIKQTNARANAYIELTFADTAEACISAVSAHLAYHGAGTAGNDGSTRVRSGGTETVVYTGAMNTTTLSYRRAVVSSGAGAWTPALLNALVARVGYSSDVNPNPYWDALLLEYDVPISF